MPPGFPALSEGKPGLLGAIIGRAEAQAVRLAMLYALLDQRTAIGLEHLRAALALVRSAQEFAAYIWGGMLGDPVADDILRALKATPAGLNRTAINNLFSRHQHEKIGAALAMLLKGGKVRIDPERTGGRSAELWRAM